MGRSEFRGREKEETRDLRSPREPEHPPSWVEFLNFPKEPSGPPPGHARVPKEPSGPPPGYPDTSTSPSNRVVIAKAKTNTGSLTTVSTSSVRSVQGDRKVTLSKASSPAIASKPRPAVPKAAIEAPQGAPGIATKSHPPVPKASSVASDSRPKARPVLKEPPLPPPPKGSVARGLALQEQRPKSSSGAASSSSSVPVPKGQPLAPQYLLPDYCRYLTWDSQGKLRDFSTRGFVGVQGVYTELPARRKFCLCLDWHQVLDRSRTQSAWAVQRVPKENLELLKWLKNLFGNHLVIAIVSHIENSAKNEAGLIEACNRTEGLNHLVSFVIVTRSRDGPLGKLKAIEALTQRKSSALIVDDNILVIDECCRFIHTIHLHLRRKPWATAPDKVEQYLEDCGDHIAAEVHRSVPDWGKDDRVRVQDR